MMSDNEIKTELGYYKNILPKLNAFLVKLESDTEKIIEFKKKLVNTIVSIKGFMVIFNEYRINEPVIESLNNDGKIEKENSTDENLIKEEASENVDERISNLDMLISRFFSFNDYKLTSKTDINLWLDKLRMELVCNDLGDVIDEKCQVPQNMSEANQEKRKKLVRAIIISRLDDKYHLKVFLQPDPKSIINKLIEVKKNERNIMHQTSKTKSYQKRIRRRPPM